MSQASDGASDMAMGATDVVDAIDEGPPPERGGEFYRVNPRKLRFRDLARDGKYSRAVLVWLSFRLGASNSDLSLEDPAVESLEPFRQPFSEMEENEKPLFEQAMKDVLAAGFQSPTMHASADVLQKTEYRSVALPHRSRPIVARVRLRLWHVGPQAKLMSSLDLLTAYSDGSMVRTCNVWPVGGPKNCRVVVVPNAGVAELLQAHEKALGERMSASTPVPVGTPVQAAAMVERFHEAWRSHHLSTGLYVRQSAADAARQAALTAGFGAAGKGASRHPAVYAELEALQRKNGSVVGMIVLLVISVLVFVGLGMRGQSLLKVLALVPILFVHEMGHFIAMKAFGYRDVRMFFIPGLGAAATGRHYNVPAWKKAIVFLMGPLPGIVLGIILGLVGILLKQPPLVMAGFMTTALNGFNLIPILPLDGGHVMHLILFSRARWLDMGVRVLAALTLMFVAHSTGSYLLIGLGVAALLGLGHVNLIQRVAAELRREGVSQTSEDDQSIPVEVADRITDKLLASAKKPPIAKILAAQVAQVFESLNSRPPGVLASLGLGSVHLLGFAAAVVFSVVFAFSNNGKLQQFMQSAANQPKHRIASGAELVYPDRPAGERDAACATFKSKSEADAAFAALQAGAGPGQTVARLADTVVVYYPAGDEGARKQAVDAMQTLTSDYFVASKDMQASFRFGGLVPDSEADGLMKELTEYFGLPYEHPMAAPWSTITRITPRQQLARKTYARIEEAQRGIWKDPEVEALRERADTARKRGELADAKALAEQSLALQKSIRRQRIAALQSEGGDIHSELIAAYLAALDASTDETEYTALGAAAAPFLGAPSAGDLTYALYGYATVTSGVVKIQVIFADPLRGAKAFSDWLIGRKCTSLRYDLSGNRTDGEDD